jgi:hypothetical protein
VAGNAKALFPPPVNTFTHWNLFPKPSSTHVTPNYGLRDLEQMTWRSYCPPMARPIHMRNYIYMPLQKRQGSLCFHKNMGYQCYWARTDFAESANALLEEHKLPSADSTDFGGDYILHEPIYQFEMWEQNQGTGNYKANYARFHDVCHLYLIINLNFIYILVPMLKLCIMCFGSIPYLKICITVYKANKRTK